MTCEEELASMKAHRRERGSRSPSKKQSGCHFRPFSPSNVKHEEFDEKIVTPITSLYEELDKYYKLSKSRLLSRSGCALSFCVFSI